MSEHLLSAVIFVPLLGALVALFAPERAAKVICTLFALVALVLSIPLATDYNSKALRFGPGSRDANRPTTANYYEDTILRSAFDEHGIVGDNQKQAALELMRANKAEQLFAARVVAANDADKTALRAEHDKSRRLEKARIGFHDAFGGPYNEGTTGVRFDELERDLSDLDDAAHGAFAQNMRFAEHMNWIPRFRIHYLVAIDGLSLPLILLTTLLTVLCLVYSWQFDYDKPPAERRPLKGFYILFLLLETGLVGVFCALDFFLFFVFWELVLLPSYFLIGIWGGENRNYASIKFFIYTLVGSITMLIAMLALYFHFEPHTFNVLALLELAREYGGPRCSRPASRS